MATIGGDSPSSVRGFESPVLLDVRHDPRRFLWLTIPGAVVLILVWLPGVPDGLALLAAAGLLCWVRQLRRQPQEGLWVLLVLPSGRCCRVDALTGEISPLVLERAVELAPRLLLLVLREVQGGRWPARRLGMLVGPGAGEDFRRLKVRLRYDRRVWRRDL